MKKRRVMTVKNYRDQKKDTRTNLFSYEPENALLEGCFAIVEISGKLKFVYEDEDTDMSIEVPLDVAKTIKSELEKWITKKERYKYPLMEAISLIHGLTTGTEHEGGCFFEDPDLTEKELVEWLELRVETWESSRSAFENSLKDLCVSTINDWKEEMEC